MPLSMNNMEPLWPVAVTVTGQMLSVGDSIIDFEL